MSGGLAWRQTGQLFFCLLFFLFSLRGLGVGGERSSRLLDPPRPSQTLVAGWDVAHLNWDPGRTVYCRPPHLNERGTSKYLVSTRLHTVLLWPQLDSELSPSPPPQPMSCFLALCSCMFVFLSMISIWLAPSAARLPFHPPTSVFPLR